MALSWLLDLRESLAKLRGLVRVRQVALLRWQAGLLVLRRPLHHRRRLHLVDGRESLRKVGVLLQGVPLIWQRLLTMPHVRVALRRIDGGNIGLTKEVLSIVVLVSCPSWRLIVAHRIVAARLANIVDLDLVFLLELVNASVEPLHLPHVVLVQLVLILIVIVIANWVVAWPVSHPATKFASELHIGLSAGLTQCSCGASVVAVAIVAHRTEAARVLVALLVLLRLVVHA